MKRSEKRWFLCLDCGVSTLDIDEFYMVHAPLWASVAPKKGGKGMLCIGCLEARLGRLLKQTDFTNCKTNYDDTPRSARLLDRLKRT